MKKSLLFFAVLLAAAGDLRAQSDVIVRIHFLGGDKISADANSAAFTDEFCSPEALSLESQTLDKLSRAPYAWFKSKISSDARDGAPQLRPLLDDLLKSEWIFEMRDAAGGSPEYALAIHLSNERAQLWQNNLQNLLESWTKLPAQKIPSGWQLKKHLPPDLIQTTYNGGWLVVGCGQNELPLSREILDSLLKTKTAGQETSWLSADLNWPRLAELFPALAKFDFPKIQLRIAGRDKNLQLTGKLILSQPLPPLENWRLPQNTIHQPFVSFTAVRGIAPWLQKQRWAQAYEISPLPDQFFFWGGSQIPFQTFAAAPVPDAKIALAQLGEKLNARPVLPQNTLFGPITAEMTNNEIHWRGVPFASPFVRALREPAGDFLLGGFFPNVPRSQPLPPAWSAALDQPTLVFYHWENTAARLKDLPQLTQLLLLLSGHRQLGSQSVAEEWLNRIGPKLGSTVTEVKQTAPDELTFSRNAPGGLTAIELVALANWLEAPDFPDCDLRLPPRKYPPMHIHQKAPAPAPTH